MRRTRSCARRRTRSSSVSGDDNPDGCGVVWYEAGTPHPCRYRTTMPMWAAAGSRRRVRRRQRTRCVAAARLASPGLPHRRRQQRAVRLGALVVLAQRPDRGFTNGIGDSPARRVERRAVTPASRATPTPRCCSRSILDRLDAGAPPAAALVDGSPLVAGGHDGPLNCCSPTGTGWSRPPWATRCSPRRPTASSRRAARRRPGVGTGSRPIRRRRSTPVRDPHRRSRRDPDATATSASTCTSIPTTRAGARGRRAAPASPRRPKTLPPKYFYDDRGSQLFDEITRLPEYYPTRAERDDPRRRTPRHRRPHRRRHARSSSARARRRRHALLLDALDAHGHARGASCRST